MFPLHESTQRNLCRAAFVAFCLAPTLLLLVYGARLQMPGYRAAFASEIQHSTGVVVSLDDLVHPRPGETRLTNVRLFDRETSEEIAKIRVLEIVHVDGRVVAHAAQLQFDARNFARAWRRIEECLLDTGPVAAKHFEFRAADLTITSPDAESQTWRQVQLIVERNKKGATAELRYVIAGVEMTQPAVLRVARRRDKSSKIVQHLEWHTGAAALPVAPWCAKFPWLARLGINCEFRGELTADETANGWHGELRGELRRIDLDTLVSEQFPHKLSGEAQAIIEHLRFDVGRIVSVRGRVEAGPGVIGESLVAAAREQLKMQSDGEAAEKASPSAIHRYQQLALHFALDDGRLQLRGECGAVPQHTALVMGASRFRTTEGDVGPLALVRTLSPDSDHLVPATEATRNLVRVLPLPKETQQRDGAARGHLRAARETPREAN
jgi:hypothetical protein